VTGAERRTIWRAVTRPVVLMPGAALVLTGGALFYLNSPYVYPPCASEHFNPEPALRAAKKWLVTAHSPGVAEAAKISRLQEAESAPGFASYRFEISYPHGQHFDKIFGSGNACGFDLQDSNTQAVIPND
jgi:hypothetical protein